MSKKIIGLRLLLLVSVSFLLVFGYRGIRRYQTQTIPLIVQTKESEQVLTDTLLLRYPKAVKPNTTYDMTLTYSIHKGRQLLCGRHTKASSHAVAAQYGCSAMKTTKTIVTTKKSRLVIQFTMSIDPHTITKSDGTVFDYTKETLCPQITLTERKP